MAGGSSDRTKAGTRQAGEPAVEKSGANVPQERRQGQISKPAAEADVADFVRRMKALGPRTGSGRGDECIDVRCEGAGACLHAVCPLGPALLLTSDVADADRTRDSPVRPR